MSGRLTKTQRDKVAQVASVINAPARVATDCLVQAGWDMEAALNYYYSTLVPGRSGNGRAARPDRAAIAALFNKYRDSEAEDVMMAEGVGRFCEDLGVEPEDPVTLVISFYFQAATMGEFSRAEFEPGMLRLQCDSLDKLRAALPKLRAQLDDPSKFPAIYNFAYGFSLEKRIKCLPQDVAIAMWQLLLPPHRWRYTRQWCDFLQRAHNRAISRDTWTQLLDFIRSTAPDFSNYDDAGAWPYLIDEFVADMREQGYGSKMAAS